MSQPIGREHFSLCRERFTSRRIIKGDVFAFYGPWRDRGARFMLSRRQKPECECVEKSFERNFHSAQRVKKSKATARRFIIASISALSFLRWHETQCQFYATLSNVFPITSPRKTWLFAYPPRGRGDEALDEKFSPPENCKRETFSSLLMPFYDLFCRSCHMDCLATPQPSPRTNREK